MNRELSLEQVKQIEIDLLEAVDSICKQEEFRYSMGGGTLLGAVRHRGFIPWDDDIDIMMPRPDYNAFLQYCFTHDVPFKIKAWENDKTYTDLSAKIYNPDTVTEDENFEGERIGVAIDVFPIDGLGDTYKKAQKAFRSTAFKRELLVAANWKKFFRSKTHAWYLEPIRFGMFVISRFVNKQKLFASVLRKYETIDFDTTAFAAAVGGSYREKEILPRAVFSEYITLPFEDKEFQAIADYDTYMKSIFGDYMTLPPEEKRVSHHTFTAYYKD